MRKITKLIPFLLLFVSGCSWFGTPTPEFSRDGYPYQQEITGTVKSESWQPGMLYTHRLVDSSGETKIFMKSSELSLSKYEDQEVTAKGKVDLATDNLTEVLFVTEIETITEEVQMQTFSAGSIDFTVQYPSNLEPRKLTNGVRFYNTDGEVIFRVTQLAAISTDLTENILELGVIDPALSQGTNESITVQNLQAQRRTVALEGKEITAVYLLGASNFYTFEFFNVDPTRESYWADYLDQMLDTFSADDLTSLQAQGEFCGGTLNVPCPANLICLLDGAYAGAGGTCITADTITQDTAMITEACNNTEGFISTPDFTCPTGLSCTILPVCECSGSRIWDEIAGCIDADSVTSTTTEPTAIETAPLGPDLTLETSDDTLPSSAISGETRHMESTPWHFALEYPKNWYYISIGNGSYVFSPDETPENNPAVTVTKIVDCNKYTDYKNIICQVADSTHFLFEYEDGYLTEAQAMADTIIPTE